MKKLERVRAINKLSLKNPKWIHRDIFRILYKDDIWLAAYENLKSNKGALTPGSSPETMDGMSLDRLKRLKDKVCDESYKFKPVKLVYIPAANGKRRPLGLPTANDKIVQEVMRIILEAIYEPNFSKLSFGFRKGKGCHNALDHVENRFRWVDFVIEGDIQQAYPTINHHILIKVLKKRIDDPRFIRLVYKLLGCGVLDEERVIWQKTGVPQGSIVSPILANIYYHELDNFVQDIKEKTETPKLKINNLKSSTYKSLEHQISRLSKRMKGCELHSSERRELAKELKIIRAKRLNTPGLKDKKIRIEYVRYADDWMIGIAGDRKLAYEIKDKVANFMKENLEQELHPDKTKITDLRKGNAHFLGYEIFLPRNRPISSYTGKGVKTIRRGQRQLRLDIPIDRIIDRYEKRGYLKKLTNKCRPISKASYTVLEDHVIVSHYRKIWQGLEQYYSGCTNRGRLQYIHYLLHTSCAMTLGHRHRLSSAKIFRKHGKFLKVKIPGTDKTESFPYKTSWKLSERKWHKGRAIATQSLRYVNQVSRSTIGLPCIICNSEDSPREMHHVKHVRKQGFRYGGFHQMMALLNRKQVPLCRNCHQKVHKGLYDGPSLEILRKRLMEKVDS